MCAAQRNKKSLHLQNIVPAQSHLKRSKNVMQQKGKRLQARERRNEGKILSLTIPLMFCLLYCHLNEWMNETVTMANTTLTNKKPHRIKVMRIFFSFPMWQDPFRSRENRKVGNERTTTKIGLKCKAKVDVKSNHIKSGRKKKIGCDLYLMLCDS